jgi:hypothetical protein
LALAELSPACFKSGAIAGWVALAAGAVEVGSAGASVGDPASPLQATAAMRPKLSTAPAISFRVKFEPEIKILSRSLLSTR